MKKQISSLKHQLFGKKTFFLPVLIVLFFCNSNIAFSQVQFTAKATKTTIAQGERFKVTFNINANGSGFRAPVLSNFSVLSGPNQSSSMQWINGAMSSSKSFSYVLTASKVGEYAIGAASIVVNGKKYQTKPITIKVLKGSAQQQAAAQQQQANKKAGGIDLADLVFVKSFVNKSKVVVGEQIIATYKLYFRADISSLNLSESPVFNGFWTEEIEQKQQKNSIENIKGVRFNVVEIYKVALFPQRAGELTVAPLSLDLLVKIQDKGRARSVFDQFFGRFKNVEYSTKSHARTITVSPLPAKGKPANFSGVVGKFTFNASIDRNNLKSNEAINLEISIKGSGNLNIIDEPIIHFPPDFEVYDPKIKNNISVTANGVTGRKTFEYLVIPRHGGDFEIAPIEFTYYDNRAKKYVTKKSKPFKIHVEKGDDEDEYIANSPTGANKEAIKVVGKDIRFIQTNNLSVRKKGEYFFGSTPYYLLMGLPFFLLLGFIVARKKMASFNSDIALVKGRKAKKIAKKSLAMAEKHLKDSNSTAFYEEISKALYGYIGNKLNIDTAQLSAENIYDNLAQKGVNDEIINQFSTLIEHCEMARFTPTQNKSEKAIYDQSAQIISKIEEAI